mgnify:CR=1 FL=1
MNRKSALLAAAMDLHQAEMSIEAARQWLLKAKETAADAPLTEVGKDVRRAMNTTLLLLEKEEG